MSYYKGVVCTLVCTLERTLKRRDYFTIDHSPVKNSIANIEL